MFGISKAAATIWVAGVVRTYALTLVPHVTGVFGEVNLYILFANELPTVIFSIVLCCFCMFGYGIYELCS